MTEFRQPVPAEDEQSHEGGFQKERHETFDRQRSAEDVADIMRVIGPVGAELKFHGDAGGHPHGKIDAEQLAPEFRDVAPDFTACHHIGAFHDGKQEREPERERNEEEVIKSSRRKLESREADWIKVEHCGCSSPNTSQSKSPKSAETRLARRCTFPGPLATSK